MPNKSRQQLNKLPVRVSIYKYLFIMSDGVDNNLYPIKVD